LGDKPFEDTTMTNGKEERRRTDAFAPGGTLLRTAFQCSNHRLFNSEVSFVIRIRLLLQKMSDLLCHYMLKRSPATFSKPVRNNTSVSTVSCTNSFRWNGVDVNSGIADTLKQGDAASDLQHCRKDAHSPARRLLYCYLITWRWRARQRVSCRCPHFANVDPICSWKRWPTVLQLLTTVAYSIH